ncbi:Mur ligase family protein [Helicobacter bizzozeronii]|uniref:Mur ligase family protein n=1 Tax=Helicobacter bizzozeronii TaxID=56877 RepID=UPI000CEF4016|nr:UDP-N-acetylmuramoyl-tripeptide--D-alanyl-D-alanine ligase [Helicobacter bizzozeronii]
MEMLDLLVVWAFVLGLNYYLMTLLQWYNYSFYRICTKHHKWRWHVYHALLPLGVFIATHLFKIIWLFDLFVGVVQLPWLIVWAIKLDKRLVFTPRVLRFFGFLFLLLITDAILGSLQAKTPFGLYLLLIALAHLGSQGFEKLASRGYIQLAKSKLQRMTNLQIIAITGSFGKTSIKNYLYQMLQNKYNVHATLGSVNTLLGLSQDINNNLDETTAIYIAEAGARQKGDIRAIGKLLEHHYAIITEIGNQHIEYFKNIETIYETKAELLDSPRLIQAFCYHTNPLDKYCPPEPKQKILPYPGQIRNIEATLEGTRFELFLDHQWVAFQTNILGAFNVENISLAVMVGFYFKIPIPQLKKIVAKLKPVPHRLHLVHVNDKVIIDDGFNGNLKGMLESVRLASLYEGRKIIVTPGLVESDEASNKQLAQAIDGVFSIVIITGELNVEVFASAIERPQKVFLKDKSQLEQVLQTMTFPKDLILFANDAPNYI